MDFDSLNITRLGIRDLETHELGVQQLSVARLSMKMSVPTEVLLFLTMMCFLLMCLSTVCYHHHRLNQMRVSKRSGDYIRVGRGEAI